MSVRIENYGTINFSPKESEIREKIKKCEKQQHTLHEENIGHCFNRYICEKCHFSYSIDSSD